MNNIDKLACYSDFLHCVNLIKGPQVKYHIHAGLIQDINEMFSQKTNVSLYHTLKEGKQCTDFFGKVGDFSDANFLTHVSPQHKKASAKFLKTLQCEPSFHVNNFFSFSFFVLFCFVFFFFF
jgi:hypothetical protein